MKLLNRSLAVAILATVSLALVGCGDDDDNTVMTDDLVIELSWTQAGADLDLGVAGPNQLFAGLGDVEINGAIVTDGSVTSSRDIIDGPGTETITFDDSAEDGTYTVIVDAVGPGQGFDEIEYDLRIESDRTTETRSGTLTEDEEVTITFTKDRGTLTF